MNEESIIFFLDLIFNPNVKDGSFENVEKQKNKLRQQIISIKDNKIKYSMLKMMETVKDRPYSYNTFGYIEEIDDNKVLKEAMKVVKKVILLGEQ